MADVTDPTTQQYNAVTTRAQAQAQSKYYDALAAGQSQDYALKQAQFAWQKEMDAAGQTGKWQGQWNMPSEQYFANTFGTWMPNGPQAGQQTLAAQNQGYNQAQGFGQLYGQYYAPGTTPTAGTQTLGAIGQAQQNAATVAGLTGWYNAPGVTPTVQPSAFHAQDQATQQMYLQYNGNDPNAAAAKWAQDASAAMQNASGGAGGGGGGGGQGTQTLAGQQQQWQQGFSQQGFEAAQRQLGQQNTQQYLQLLSSLRGPADWAKYQEVLGATPGGMRDLYAAAAGQYVPGGGATTGMQPQAANLTTMMQQVAGQPVTWSGQGSVPQGQLTNPMAQQYPQQGGQQRGGQQQMPPGGQMQLQAAPQAGQFQAGPATNWQAGIRPAGWQKTGLPANQMPEGGYMQTGPYTGGQTPAAGQFQAGPYTGGQQQPQQTWGSGIGVGGNQATPQQQQQAQGNGTNMYGGQQQQYNLPAPNQISSQAWNNFTPSQQQMMLGNYESAGWDKGDVQSLYNQSLPKYGTNNASAGTWRLH